MFAPEFDIAFFGGDPDNFEYPRYDLDVCFFRAYEDGKPARPKHYLKWSPDGSKDGDLVFVAGHPGRTSRLNTLAHLEYLRDVSFPLTLELLHDREAFLLDYGKKGPEQARQSKEDLFGYQNSRKAREGGLKGLKDEALMARKARGREGPPRRIAADPKKQAAYGAAWDKIAEAQKVSARIARRYNFLERGFAFDSHLFQIARTLVRLAEEKGKPNSDRLKRIPRLGARLAQAPALLRRPHLSRLRERPSSRTRWPSGRQKMGDDPMVERVLRGRSPEQAAKDLVEGSKLADVSVRKGLAEASPEAIARRDDPMIKLALAVDADARALRKTFEDEVEGVLTAQYALIAKATFEDQGASVYPDATFTLRLAFGTVKGYEVDGKTVAPFTTIGGAFRHADAHGNTPPYQLPTSWIEARDAEPAAARHAAELRLDGRHHRRQLGEPGGQPRQRGRRPDLRRQHPVARARLRLRRPRRPRRLGRLARDRRGAAVDLPRRRARRGADRHALIPGRRPLDSAPPRRSDVNNRPPTD